MRLGVRVLPGGGERFTGQHLVHHVGDDVGDLRPQQRREALRQRRQFRRQAQLGQLVAQFVGEMEVRDRVVDARDGPVLRGVDHHRVGGQRPDGLEVGLLAGHQVLGPRCRETQRREHTAQDQQHDRGDAPGACLRAVFERPAEPCCRTLVRDRRGLPGQRCRCASRARSAGPGRPPRAGSAGAVRSAASRWACPTCPPPPDGSAGAAVTHVSGSADAAASPVKDDVTESVPLREFGDGS